MQHNLAIALLIIGMTAAAAAQERPGSPDAPLSAGTTSIDHKEQKQRVSEDAKGKPDKKSDAKQEKHASSDRKQARQSEASDRSSQNQIEYGG